MELQGRLEELRKSGLGVASVTYDSREILAGFADRNKITFPLLSDVGSATIRRYGIVNTVVEDALSSNSKDPALLADVQRYVTANEPAERHRGIPFPGTFVVDRQGRVTSRFFEDFYWERNTTSNIMLRTGTAGAPAEATRISTQHLDVTAYTSDASVGPGARFSLILDVTPKPGMHVYAPGASQYRVINLGVTPAPYLRTSPIRYPPSEIYHFVPLNERVPVYQKPFTLAVEVVRENTPEARKAQTGMTEMAVSGVLEYQACDDKICYNPVSLPMSWKVGLRANVPGAPAPAQR